MAEEPPELKEYVINKIGEDGQPFADKSSENYTGKAQVQYPNGDQYDGDFKNGVREGEGTMTYHQLQVEVFLKKKRTKSLIWLKMIMFLII